jgi:hypothetical protein
MATAGGEPGAGEGGVLRRNLSKTAGAGAPGLSLNFEGLHETGDRVRGSAVGPEPLGSAPKPCQAKGRTG